MNRNLAMSLIICLGSSLLPAQKAAPSVTENGPAILGPGRYYRRDVPSLDGEWWALSKGEKGWELRRATLQSEPIAMAGDKKGKKSGLEITVKGDEAALLLRKVPGVAAFRTLSGVAAFSTSGEGVKDQRVAGTMGNRPFTLWSEPASLGKTHGYVMKLDLGGQEEVLFINPVCDGCGWELMWAGDLDGDGKLDLLIGTTDQDDFGTFRLFLSGEAVPGHGVRQVATQRWIFGD